MHQTLAVLWLYQTTAADNMLPHVTVRKGDKLKRYYDLTLSLDNTTLISIYKLLCLTTIPNTFCVSFAGIWKLKYFTHHKGHKILGIVLQIFNSEIYKNERHEDGVMS